jgi:hypothetical protein
MTVFGMRRVVTLGTVLLIGAATGGVLSEARADKDHRNQFAGGVLSLDQRINPDVGNQQFPGDLFRPGQRVGPEAGGQRFPGEPVNPGVRISPDAGSRGSLHPDGYYRGTAPQ